VGQNVVASSEDSSGFAPPPPKPLYFGDMDDVLRRVADHVPIVDTERLYHWELETQRKVYLAVISLGLVMLGFGLVLTIAPVVVGG
jgi:hypothetical protein